jgi:hypothetical protein
LAVSQAEAHHENCNTDLEFSPYFSSSRASPGPGKTMRIGVMAGLDPAIAF